MIRRRRLGRKWRILVADTSMSSDVPRNGPPVAKIEPAGRRPRLVSIDELRRVFSAGADPNYALMREELDAIFGEDRVGDE